MARINIEESVFKEPKYADLCISAGSRIMAVGALSCLWIDAQKFYLSHGEIPNDKWNESKLPEYLITTGWAERTLTGVKAKGQEDQFAWLRQASDAGKASADARKKAKPVQLALTGVEPRVNGRGSSSSFSSSNKETTTTPPPVDLEIKINECWKEWNGTLNNSGIKNKNLSPGDQKIIGQAILNLGFDRTKNALIGKRFEEKSETYNPQNTLSLEYCLSRNLKTGASNHERLENLALANESSHTQKQAHEDAEYIAIHGRSAV